MVDKDEIDDLKYINKTLEVLDKEKKEDLLSRLEVFKNTDPKGIELFNRAKWLQKNNFHREAIEKFTDCFKYAYKNTRFLNLIYIKRSQSYRALNESIYAFSDCYRAVRVFPYDIFSLEYFSLICENLANFEEMKRNISLLYKLTKDKKYIDIAKMVLVKQKEMESLMIYQYDDINYSMDETFTFKRIKMKCTMIKDDLPFFNKMTLDKIEFKEDTKYGRYLIAKKDIKAGEEIFSEPALVTSNSLDQICDFCFKFIENKVFSNLNEEKYCSLECKQNAYNKYMRFLEGRNVHLLKKQLLDKISKDPDAPVYAETDLAIVKIFCTIRQNEIENFDDDYSNKIKHLYIKNRYKIDDNDSFKRFIFLKENLNLDDEESFSFQFYNEMFYKLMWNLRVATEIKNKNYNENKPFHPGSGLYFYYSFINHSCDPNTKSKMNSNNIFQLFAVKKIKKGDQIFINYIPGGYKFKDYKEFLPFDCECKICIEEINNKPKKLKKKKNHVSDS